MNNYGINDTIAAISTAIGDSGIGIVRLSGKDALAIADKVFVSKDGKKPSQFKTYTVHYGWIISPQSTVHSPQPWTVDRKPSTSIIDEVLLTVMRAPRSFTKEDVVEINCHGGPAALRAVLDLALENGARMSSPGEFTKRAFLNGRIDLAQAEAVLDIIRAKNDAALRVSLSQLKGALSCEVNKIRQALLEILSALEASIDFPEEETVNMDTPVLCEKLNTINLALKRLLDSAKTGRILREGISAVICGRPNVGKSSLLNALLKQERSIVTPVAGTTRDTIEEIIDIKGIPLRIADTAGILEPRDLVEKKAVARAKKHIAAADLVILLLDNHKKLNKQDVVFFKKMAKKTVLAVVNKIDLKGRLEKEKIKAKFAAYVEISAKKMQNIDLLEEAIANLVYKGRLRAPEPAMVSNFRHIELVRKAQILIAEAANSLDNKLAPEFIAQAIKDALGCLDDLLGKSFSEDLLDKIFSEFCIGK